MNRLPLLLLVVVLAVSMSGCATEKPRKVISQQVESLSADDRAAPVSDGNFPTVETAGSRFEPIRKTGDLETTHTDQTIERTTINGRLTIKHDDITVRDVVVKGTGTYMIYIVEKENGECPRNVRLEYVEVDGSQAPADSIPIYSPECGFSLEHGLLHNLGRGIRVANDVTIQSAYIFLDRTWEGAHRSGISTHGGRNIVVRNNVIICEETGCSAAITMYGDHAPVDGYLLEHNMIATTGSYCVYGGSVDSKKYPDGSGVRVIDNHFSTRYYPECGQYGPVTGFELGVRGNQWRGNVWHESNKPIPVSAL